MSEDSGGATTYSAESYPMSTKTLSSTVNAAPFVPATAFPRPGEGPGEERPAMFQRRAASVMGFSADAPEFVPSGKGEFLAQAALNAPPFVPGSGLAASEGYQTSKVKLSPDAVAFVPRTGARDGSDSPGRSSSYFSASNGNSHPSGEGLHDSDGTLLMGMVGHQGRNVRSANGNYAHPRLPPSPLKSQHGGNGYGAAATAQNDPRRCGSQASQSYTSINPNITYLVSPGKQYLASQFMGEQLRKDMQQRTYLGQAQLSEEAAAEVEIPSLIQNYHSLYPLEDMGLAAEQPSHTLGVHTCVMKGVSMVDGAAYALRRIDGHEIMPSPARLNFGRLAVERWSSVSNHPNLVGLRDAFASSEMCGVSSLYFVHDYHPGSVTLHFAHVQNQAVAAEDQLWSYLVHLASAIRAVHSVGLALRPEGLLSTQILLTSNGRLRINSIGIIDAIEGDPLQAQTMDSIHRQDLMALGKLILSLACAGRDLGLSPLDHCAIHYSVDLVRLISALLASAEGGQLATWRHLAGALSDRSLAALDSINSYNDGLIREMTKEVENGRLMRIMVKLTTVNETDSDGIRASQWSETGDRYLLKLFRDFVFHQCNEDGTPVIDWGHIIECLNKLDAGVSEQIILTSRDERSLLVVTYADVKRCLDVSYNEIWVQSDTMMPGRRGLGVRHQR